MSSMFEYCDGLISLDLSNFNTIKVTDMSSMFMGCMALETIYVRTNWDTTKVTSSNSMFSDCINLPNFNDSVIDKTNAHTGTGGYFTLKTA